MPGDRLWAITCHFNPCGYRRRVANYLEFRRRLQVPLLAVELSFTGAFELAPGDADVLIQLTGGDVMWQKERLLNLALEALPASCDRVAWVDCDIVFQDDDWPRAANAALDRHVIIQPFEISHELRPDVGPDEFDAGHAYVTCRSLASGLVGGAIQPSFMLKPNKRGLGYAIGLAWAARRDIVQARHFYDACVVGGGPGAMLAGIMGNLGDAVEYMMLNPRRREHYLAWARPFHDAVRGDLGCCGGTVFHLWHGDLADRGTRERRLQFARFDFDPYSDIAISRAGPWQWSTNKPDMHRFVHGYFASRFEDGRPQPGDLCPPIAAC